MPRISDEVIQEILAKTDLVDLVSEKVTLSKQGKSYFGLCPFHQEKTPSFSVEPERKIYNCFSCGEKGNAVTFLQRTENLSFVEAMENLANRAQVAIDFTPYHKENPNKKYFDINSEAKNFYKFFLSNTKQGLTAQTYLKQRGIDENIVQAFELGLAPTEYDTLYKTLSEKEYLVSDMYDLGLVKQSKTESYYDLFRERIIFPIHDEHGNVVAFSGRVYLENDTSAKYINSPQTIVFTKSNVLYNMHRALNDIKRTKRVVLFEGYMDVIAAYRAGIKESVASMGTSLTTEQVKKIKQYANQVVVCYDGDPAGLEATARAVILFKQAKMDVQIVMLPDRLDPDDYIEKYSEKALADYINNQSIDSLEFSYRQSNMNIDFTKMLDIERFKKLIFDLVKNTSNTIIESYLHKLSQDTNISVESIRQDFNQYTKRNVRNIDRKYKRNIPIDSKYEVAERKLLNYFMKDYKYIAHFNEEFGEVFFINSVVRDMKHIIEDLHYSNHIDENSTEIDFNEFYEQLSDDQKMFYESKVAYKNLEIMDEEYSDFIDTINQYLHRLLIESIEEEIRNAPTNDEKIKLAVYRDISNKEEKNGQK